MVGVHCERFPDCWVVGESAAVPTCDKPDCPGKVAKTAFAKALAGAIAMGQEPADADSETIAEMSAQIWAAGATLEDADFIARMLFRNGKRIVNAHRREAAQSAE